MAVLHRGRTFPFDSPLDLLRFAPLTPLERLRTAAATGVQLVRADRRRLDRAPVSVEGPRWFGRRGYEALWQPLLEAKFGPHADQVAMAWLVARIRQRGGARQATGDRLGYLRGSLGTLAEAYATRLVADGVELRTSTLVQALRRTAAGWEIDLQGPEGPACLVAPVVIAAVSGPMPSAGGPRYSFGTKMTARLSL